MRTIVNIIGLIGVSFICVMALLVIIGILGDIIRTFFKKEEPPRNPTPREKLELENEEYDWGHNVKNYMEE